MAADYPEITVDDYYIDIMAANLVNERVEKADLLERALDICMYKDKKLKITGREDGCTCSEFGDYVMETVRKISE